MFISRLHITRLTSGSQRENGFTILELMVASSVFAVILLVVAFGVISFTNSYYKGVTSSKTQAVARSIMNNIAESIQFGKDISVPAAGAGGAQGLCIDNTLYSYVIGQQVTDVNPNGVLHQGFHGLVVSSSGCTTPTVPNASSLVGSRELLGQHMRLGAFDVTPSGGLYTIHIRVIYGDDDLLTSTAWASARCGGSIAGSQFCAVSDLTTTVEQRLL